MTRLNNALGWFLIALVLLSPIPVGSNAPMAWAVSALAIGLAGILYFLNTAVGHHALRFPPNRIKLLVFLGTIFCVYLVVQILPLGAVLGPFGFVTGQGGAVVGDYLSIDPGSTALMLLRMLSYGLVFFLTLQVAANEARANRLITIIFWIVVAHAAFGLIQLNQLDDTMLGFEKIFYQGMATGTFINRNSFATFLAMGVAVGTGLIVNALGRVSRGQSTFAEVGLTVFSQMAGILILLVGIAASQSRMGLISALLGAILVMALSLRWIRWRPMFVALFVALALGAFVGLISLFGQDTLLRITMLDETGSGRTDIYAQVMEMIEARPFLGYGGGSFESAFQMFQHAPLPVDRLVDRAHSTYLQLFAELGLVFGSMPILIVLIVFGGVLLRYVQADAGSGVRLAAMGAVFAAAIHSAVDFSLEMQAITYLMVVLLGLGRGIARRTSSE